MDCFCGPFDEGLSHEGWALPSPVHPGLFSTSFSHGCDARVLLHFGSVVESIPVFTEGGEEPGREDDTRARQGSEQGVVRHRGCELCDGFVELFDELEGGLKLFDKGQGFQGAGIDDGGVVGQCCSSLDRLNACFDELGSSDTVFSKEALQGTSPGSFDLFEGGPAVDKRTEDKSVLVAKPLYRLRIVGFQGRSGSPYLFVSERGSPMATRNVRQIVARAGQSLSFPVHPHMLRHGCGYKLINDGVDVRTVQQYLPLQIAGLRILEARAELGVAVGNFYPQQQQATGDYIYADQSKNTALNVPGVDLSFANYSAAFDAAWELDFWGKFRRGIESADAGFLASIADYDDLLVTLTAEVARAYAAMRTFEERLRISLENVDIQRESVKIAEARFKFGATTELDTKQAQTLLYSTLATVPDLQASIRQTRNAIAVLLGITPNQVDAIIGEQGGIPQVPEAVTVGIPAELIRRRPDIRRSELEAASQSALIGVARSDLYPSFVLFGTIGVASRNSFNAPSSTLFESDSVFFQGGPSFSWNLFNYGRIKNQVRVQDARFQQLLINYQDTVLRAVQEAEDSITGFLRTREQLEYLDSGVAAAQRAVEIALLQYQEGAADYTRVLNTQESLFREQEREVTARGLVVTNLVGLYKALGGGWQIRVGNEFVSEETKEQMQQRTNWGPVTGYRSGS